MRTTIIGYTPTLVVYATLRNMLVEKYMLHLGAHLSPLFACFHLTLFYWGVCSVCNSWLLGSWFLKFIYVSLSIGIFTFEIPNITTSVLSPALGSSEGPSVGIGSMTTPRLMHQFKSVHIPPSPPFFREFSILVSSHNTSVHSHGGGSGYMSIGSIGYIPSCVLSSTTRFFFECMYHE